MVGNNMDPELLQLGAIAIIFIFTIKEYFAYQKSKSNGVNGKNYDSEQNERLARVEARLHAIETNHLVHIEKDINLIRKEIDKICHKLDKL